MLQPSKQGWMGIVIGLKYDGKSKLSLSGCEHRHLNIYVCTLYEEGGKSFSIVFVPTPYSATRIFIAAVLLSHLSNKGNNNINYK